MPKAKHIPIRQCIACRERRPKRELLRIVTTEAGPVLDPTGRKPGRGAYVCPDRPECWTEKKLRRFAGAKATELSLALQMVLGGVLSQTSKAEKPSQAWGRTGGQHGKNQNLPARQGTRHDQ